MNSQPPAGAEPEKKAKKPERSKKPVKKTTKVASNKINDEQFLTHTIFRSRPTEIDLSDTEET